MVVGIRLGSNSKTTLLWHNSPWCFLKSLNNHITIFNGPLNNHRFDGLTHSVFMAITGTYRWGIYSMSTTLPPSARDQRHSARASGRCRQPHLLLQCLWPARCIFERLGDGGWVLFEWGFGHCLFASCVPTWSNCLFVLCQLFAGSSSIVFHQQLLFGLCFYSIPSSWDVSGGEISNATPPPQGQNISNSTFITLILRPNIGYTHLPP